jgi:hypothetical protein
MYRLRQLLPVLKRFIPILYAYIKPNKIVYAQVHFANSYYNERLIRMDSYLFFKFFYTISVQSHIFNFRCSL